MLKPVTNLTLLVCMGLLLAGCSNRRAAEAQFLGTWSRTSMDSTTHLTFQPDHTFIQSGESLGEYTVFGTGTWHLDYQRILVQYKPSVSAPDDSGEERLIILNVADVTPDELKISHKDWVETYRRAKMLTREEIQGMADKRVILRDGQRLCAKHKVALVTVPGFTVPAGTLYHDTPALQKLRERTPNAVEEGSQLQRDSDFPDPTDITYCPRCEAELQQLWDAERSN